jgi:hypothetical protein
MGSALGLSGARVSGQSESGGVGSSAASVSSKSGSQESSAERAGTVGGATARESETAEQVCEELFGRTDALGDLRALASRGVSVQSFPGAGWPRDESVLARGVDLRSRLTKARSAAAGASTPWYRT